MNEIKCSRCGAPVEDKFFVIQNWLDGPGFVLAEGCKHHAPVVLDTIIGIAGSADCLADMIFHLTSHKAETKQ